MQNTHSKNLDGCQFMKFTGRKIFGLALFIFLLSSAIVLAQNNNNNTHLISEVKILTWASETPINWQIGLILFAFGAFGAMFVIFTLVGGSVPGTDGQARIEINTARLDALCDLQDVLLKKIRPTPMRSTSLRLQ
jgi:hypothetical protein